MAAPLVPKRWEGQSLFTAEHFLDRLMAGQPRPHVHRQVVVCDSLEAIQRLARETHSEVQVASELRFLNEPRSGVTVVGTTNLSASGTATVLEVVAELGAEDVVHLGVAAGMKDEVLPGDVLVADAAYRDDGISAHYLPPGDLVIGDTSKAGAWKDRLATAKVRTHRGALWTCSSLLRTTPETVAAFARRGVLGVDTDAAAALAVGAVRGTQVVCLRVVTDLLQAKRWESHALSSEVHISRWRLLELVVKEWR